MYHGIHDISNVSNLLGGFMKKLIRCLFIVFLFDMEHIGNGRRYLLVCRGGEIGVFAFTVLEKVVQPIIVAAFKNDTVFLQF